MSRRVRSSASTFAEDPRHLAVVVEQEEAPRAMVRARLPQHRDRHRAVVLLGLRRVAERGPGVVQQPERGGVERPGDGELAGVGRAAPVVPDGVQARQGAEQAVVAREDREAGLELALGLVELPGPERQVARAGDGTTRPARAACRGAGAPRRAPGAGAAAPPRAGREARPSGPAAARRPGRPDNWPASRTAARPRRSVRARARSRPRGRAPRSRSSPPRAAPGAASSASVNRCCPRRLEARTPDASSFRPRRSESEWRAVSSARTRSSLSAVSRARWR